MIRFVLKRLLYLIPVVIAVSFIIFGLMELTPGDVTDTMISESMTQEDIAGLRAKYNLDKSMFYRYGLYMFGLVQGDLGVSDVTGLNIWRMFISRLPNTLLLSFSALIFGIALAIPMGIIAARKAGTIIDNITTGVTLIGMSMPIFWVGILLLILFSLRLGWLPGGGYENGLRSLILPAVCTGLSMTASTARQTRSGMLEVLRADFLRTARAKGVPESTVITKHALGNAWIPIVTALGTSLCVTLAGSVVVEQVFAWPGIGRMAAEAIFARDVSTATGTIIMTTIIYVFVQLIVDLIYAFIDPRVKAKYISAVKRKKSVSTGNAMQSYVRQKSASTVDAMQFDIRLGKDEPISGNGPIPAVAVISIAPSLADQKVTEGLADTTPDITTPDITIPAIATPDIPISAVTEETDEHGLLDLRKYKRRSRFGEIFHRMRKNKGAMVGLIIFGILLGMFIISFFISYSAVFGRNSQIRLSPPNWPHLFGTDNMGRDAFQRVIYGTRYTMAIGFGGSAISLIIGVTLGAIAGYFGSKTDNVVMRITDTLASIPGMLLGMVIVTVLGQSLINLIIAVGIAGIPTYIRTTRASVLTVRNQEYIEASKAIGFRNARIIFSQVIPNGLSPIIVAFTVNFGITIVVAASLSYIGFGVPVPNPEWGTMVSMVRVYMLNAPWLATYPGLFIMITVLAFNLLGDGLRDALDPKLKR